jgi:hypothetical protein
MRLRNWLHKIIRKLFSKIFPAQQNPAANNNAAAAVNGAVNGNNGIIIN